MFFGFMLTTFTIVVAMPFFTCMPIDKMWQINPDPGREFTRSEPPPFSETRKQQR